ncbi:hypothetical protein L211DRAFT_509206 [Terfezia boudieri ATCC MYA-4762]|uniref:Uncharacterized protein n=1 Tax=Terfezia boudieri ATCC MYA-4762 TaxID=1051890 RepID=A0A3N4LGL9_9PEZI|nr:hypothetical protein L211DRAFT_509206 [Terfezia boudieri ATCC MYA-4762]
MLMSCAVMCQRKGPWVLMVELPAGSFLRLKPFFFFFFQGLFRRLPRGAAVPICRVWGGRRWPRRDPSTTYVSGPGAAERQLGEGSRKPTETRSPGDPGKASGCNRAAGGNSALFGVKGMYCMYRPGSCAGRGGVWASRRDDLPEGQGRGIATAVHTIQQASGL